MGTFLSLEVFVHLSKHCVEDKVLNKFLAWFVLHRLRASAQYERDTDNTQTVHSKLVEARPELVEEGGLASGIPR